MSLMISEVHGKDWAVVLGDTQDAIRDIRSRWAQGLGSGSYEIVRDGELLAIVYRAPTVLDRWDALVVWEVSR